MLSALSFYQIISHRVHGVHGEPRSKKYFSLFLPCWLLVLSVFYDLYITILIIFLIHSIISDYGKD